MSDLLKFGNHPDTDQLNAFVEHALPAHEREQTLAHLAICPECRTIVGLSLPPVETPFEPPADPAPKRWLSGWNLAWVAAPALAALIFFGIYVRDAVSPRGAAKTPIDVAESRPPAPQSSSPDLQQPPSKQMRASSARRLPATRPPEAKALKATPPVVLPEPVVPALPAEPSKTENSLEVSAERAPLDQIQINVSENPLPSHLPVLSVASSAHQKLALDTQNTLFLSSDDGRSWKIVPAQWQGRAVRVAVASSTRSERDTSEVTTRRYAVKSGALAPRSRADEIANCAVAGTVTDPSGAPVAGATVVVTDTSTSAAHSVMTDRAGHYRIDKLAPGGYRIEAQSPGFATQSLATDLAPGQQRVADFALEVGQVSQSIAVETSPESLAIPPAHADTINGALPGNAPLVRFEITTDAGERWISADGEIWKHN
jgi:hypothetical protein